LKTILERLELYDQVNEVFEILKSKFFAFYQSFLTQEHKESLESLNIEDLLEYFLSKLNKNDKVSNIQQTMQSLNLEPFLKNQNFKSILKEFLISLDTLNKVKSLNLKKVANNILTSTFVPSNLNLSSDNLKKAFDILTQTLDLDKFIDQIDNSLAMFSLFAQLDPEIFLNTLSPEFFKEQFAKMTNDSADKTNRKNKDRKDRVKSKKEAKKDQKDSSN
jgi:hypothetical protein